MKDQKKIRLGLIGVGNWAKFAHLRVLSLLPEYEIVAVYNQRKEVAKAAATEYGIPHVAESLGCVRQVGQYRLSWELICSCVHSSLSIAQFAL